MKGKIKQIGVALAVLVLSACAVTKEDIQQDRAPGAGPGWRLYRH